MKKLNPVEKYIGELAKMIKERNIILSGRSYWAITILLNTRDAHLIREGIKDVREKLSLKGIDTPVPPKKVQEFLDGKIKYPIR